MIRSLRYTHVAPTHYTLHTTGYRTEDCRIHTLLSCVSFLTSLRPNPNPNPLTQTCPFSPHFDLRRVFEAPLRTGRWMPPTPYYLYDRYCLYYRPGGRCRVLYSYIVIWNMGIWKRRETEGRQKEDRRKTEGRQKWVYMQCVCVSLMSLADW